MVVGGQGSVGSGRDGGEVGDGSGFLGGKRRRRRWCGDGGVVANEGDGGENGGGVGGGDGGENGGWPAKRGHGSGWVLPFTCWKEKERKMKEREEERGVNI